MPWARSLRDYEIENELNQLFGLDNPDKSEDDLQPEIENITDTDLTNILRGCNEDDVPAYS